MAVFGPTTPKENTSQYTIMEPSTVYGITKQVGETTDYAVDIYHKAITEGSYECFKSDYRQGIADSWPRSINDSYARQDWNWKHQFSLEDITKEMRFQLDKKYNAGYENLINCIFEQSPNLKLVCLKIFGLM